MPTSYSGGNSIVRIGGSPTNYGSGTSRSYVGTAVSYGTGSRVAQGTRYAVLPRHTVPTVTPSVSYVGSCCSEIF